jgi:hypothetical protein
MRFIGRGLRRAVALFLFVLIRGRKAIVVTAAVLAVGWFALANIRSLPIPAGSLPSWLPVGGPSASAPPPSGARTPASTGAPKLGTINGEIVPSVDSYIKGLTQFDAKLMWGSLSEDAINAMKSRGGSLEVLQAGLDDAKRRGARYEDITMIGNYPLSDGRKYLFYVLSRRGFSGADQLEQVYFVFTVSKDGKITRIE